MTLTANKLPPLRTMASLPSKTHILKQMSKSSTRNYRQGRSILFSEAANLSVYRRRKPDHICEYPVVPRCCNSSFSVHFSAENPNPRIKPLVDPNPAIPTPGPPSIPPETIPNYPHDPRIPQNPDPLPPEVPAVPEIPPSPDPSWPTEVPNVNPAPRPEIFPPSPDTTNPVPPPLEVPLRHPEYFSGIRDPSIFPPSNPPPDIHPPIPPVPPGNPSSDFPPLGPRRPNVPPMPSPDIPPFPDPRPLDPFPPIPSPPVPDMSVLFPSFLYFK